MTTIEKKTVTVREAAKILGIGENLAFRLVNEDQIPHVRLGNRIVISRAALDRLLEGGTNETI